MDAAHEKLSWLFPSLAEVRAEAATKYPDRLEMQNHYTRAMLEVLYAETRRVLLEQDERAAKHHPPTDDPPEDDEDETEDFDHGDPVGDLEVPALDDECVFPAAAAMPTLATDVTRREVRV